MSINLVVTAHFADFEPGNIITDADLVAQYSASHPGFVVKIDAPAAVEPPKPTPKAKPEA
jgi:hypothetical protein